MKRQALNSISPGAQSVATHLGSMVRQSRLARQWTLAELAERARVSTATLKRLEAGSSSTSLEVWLAVFERLGLLPLLQGLEDPTSAALLDETRPKRARRKQAASNLDF
jgi:transcriptional regulator with XRE-family HTH domain